MITAQHRPAGGLPYAIAAYLIWGVLPLYLHSLKHVPALELVSWRVIFSVPMCLAIVAALGQHAQLAAAMRNPRALRLLLASATFIGANWLIYIYAVQHEHVFAASMGYYINPLMNVLAGTVLLRERLSRLQWLAVAVASLGVALMAWAAADMLWISMGLAISFCAYGLIRKVAPVEALPGLTIETALMSFPALAYATWLAGTPQGTSFGAGIGTDALIVAAGAVTATPLLLFAIAARRMSYSALGFAQFLAPTVAFLLALFVFGEPLDPLQLASFVAIWSAIAIFCWDLLANGNAKNRA